MGKGISGARPEASCMGSLSLGFSGEGTALKRKLKKKLDKTEYTF
jgi:hypothetical protein